MARVRVRCLAGAELSDPAPTVVHVFDTEVEVSAADAALTVVAVSMARVAAAAEAAGLVAVAELALHRRAEGRARGLGAEECDEFTADEIGALLRMSRNAARARLFLALDLLTRRPATLAALTRGQICPVAARRISEGLAHLSPDAADQVEQEALRLAPEQTPAQLSARLTRLVLRADAEAAGRRATAAVRERRCSIRVLGDGTALLSVVGRTELVVAAYERIDTTARAICRDSAADASLPVATSPPADTSAAETSPSADAPLPVGRALDQTRADLALGMLLGDPQATTATAGVTVSIDVVAPVDTLLAGGDEPGELVGYGPISADVVRELAEDATWRRWVTDGDGTVVARSTCRYRPTTAMVELLRARDGTCRFPTCRRRVSACDLDHVIPWPDGPTDIRNLVPLCRHHHRLKHSAGWRVWLDDAGDLHWRAPSGTEHTSHARTLTDILPAPRQEMTSTDTDRAVDPAKESDTHPAVDADPEAPPF